MNACCSDEFNDQNSNVKYVRLLVSADSTIIYRVQMHEHLKETLSLLAEKFNLILYSSEYDLNLEVLTDLIEDHIGQRVFSFVLGRNFLSDLRSKARSKSVLSSIGVAQGSFIVLGADQDGFTCF